MAIYDVHSHTLPDVDDGSRSVNMTRQMLEIEMSQGVTHVVATPHFTAWRYSIDTFLERRAGGVERLQKFYSENPELPHPELYLGAEVGFFEGISRIPFFDELTVKGTNTLLIEMPWNDEWKDKYVDEVIAVQKMGYKVYLAHIERYLGDKKNIGRIERMRDAGIHAHINAGSLLKKPGGARLAKHYSSGLADMLASDTHNLEMRKPNVGPGRELIAKKCGVGKLAEIDAVCAELFKDAISII